MTKDEIKKALEVCVDIHYFCEDCPYDDVRNCSDALKNDARELITEQEKEIERLKAEKKQAKIDVLNELNEKYGFYLCYSWHRDTKSLSEIIDELIKEVENDK